MNLISTIILYAICLSITAQTKVQDASQRADRFQASVAIAKATLTKLSEWSDAWQKELYAMPTDAGATDVRVNNLNLSKTNRQKRGAPIIISRSNMKRIAQKPDDLRQADPAKRSVMLKDVQSRGADLDVSIHPLHDEILAYGNSYATKVTELKTRHETVKSAIQNIQQEPKP